MVDHQLQSYIKEALKTGHSTDAITLALVEYGWTRVDVDEAFQSVPVRLVQAYMLHHPVFPVEPLPLHTPSAPVVLSTKEIDEKESLKRMIVLAVIIAGMFAFAGWWFYVYRYAVVTYKTTASASAITPFVPVTHHVDGQVSVEQNIQQAPVFSTIDPKVFVPAGEVYLGSSFVDIDSASDGEKELVVFYTKGSPDLEIGIFKYSGGNKQNKDSWKQMYTYTTFATNVPKIISMNGSGSGAILISTTLDDSKKGIHTGGWVVVTDTFVGIPADDLYARLPFMTTQFTRVDTGKVSIVNGGFTQSFTPYDDMGRESPIVVTFLYKNRQVLQGAIMY